MSKKRRRILIVLEVVTDISVGTLIKELEHALPAIRNYETFSGDIHSWRVRNCIVREESKEVEFLVKKVIPLLKNEV